jgi:hypothetical protein
MSKHKCFKDNCRKEIPYSKCLTIGADENMLYVKNNLKGASLSKLSNYTAIHFCSKKCFITTFFRDEEL